MEEPWSFEVLESKHVHDLLPVTGIATGGEIMQDAFSASGSGGLVTHLDDPSAYLFRTAMNVFGIGIGARKTISSRPPKTSCDRRGRDPRSRPPAHAGPARCGGADRLVGHIRGCSCARPTRRAPSAGAASTTTVPLLPPHVPCAGPPSRPPPPSPPPPWHQQPVVTAGRHGAPPPPLSPTGATPRTSYTLPRRAPGSSGLRPGREPDSPRL